MIHKRNHHGRNNPHYGRKHTTEAKRKMRLAHKIRPPISDETRNKMSLSHIGERNGFWGKTHSIETRVKITIANMKRKGTKRLPFSDETRNKMSIAARERIKRIGPPKMSEEGKKRLRQKVSGPNHYRWRGGIGRKFDYGSGWPEISKGIRKRDFHRCFLCGVYDFGYYNRADVHHIIPFYEYRRFSDYDPHNQYNLVSLCRACHIWSENNLMVSMPVLFWLVANIMHSRTKIGISTL